MVYKLNDESDSDLENIKLNTSNKRAKTDVNIKWTLSLVLCSLTIALSSFQFGYNISSLNSATFFIKKFFKKQLFLFKNKQINHNSINSTWSSNNNNNDNTDKITDLIWTILNSLFVIGGLIGGLMSKLILDKLGRKRGIILNNKFSIIAAILVFVSVYFKSPLYLLVSRFFFGLQGGLSCSLVPTYLVEISPASLRGQIGLFNSFFITLGIAISQVLGFEQVLGNSKLWPYLLGLPVLPAIVCSLFLISFFPDSPKFIMAKRNDYDSALKALKLLRNSNDVRYELKDIIDELNSFDQTKLVSLCGLFKIKELKWPLITSILLQITQQLCGVNAIFFYSASIFKDAGIHDAYIQYAILATGVVNVLATIMCIPIIDKFGRRPLLLYPKIIMALNFILLTVFLTIKEKHFTYSYLSIICIIIFVICFAVGLGPLPFIYTAECFRQNSLSSAMAINSLMNWLSALLLTLTFPFLQTILQQYVFLIFSMFVFISFSIILRKVPETKGKTIDEIMSNFNS